MAPVEQHQWQALLNQTQELVQQVGVMVMLFCAAHASPLKGAASEFQNKPSGRLAGANAGAEGGGPQQGGSRAELQRIESSPCRGAARAT